MARRIRGRLFHRIFLGLSILWFAYIVVVIPIQQKRRAEDRFAQEVGECTHDDSGRPKPDSPALHSCMTQAEGMYVIRNTSAKAMYGPRGWPSLLLAGVGFPLAIYGLIAAFTVVLSRLRRSDGVARSTRSLI